MSAPTTPPRVAVITMVRDGGDLLRRWVDHYARHVGRENIVVLDDNSVDGSTADLGCTVHRLPAWSLAPDVGFNQVRLKAVNGIAGGLLAVYDYVVLADADEFLVTDPAKYPTLPDLLQARGRPPVLGAIGLNVVHVPSLEPDALDLRRPVLEQRHHAKLTPVMCKPAVRALPGARWTMSSHGITAPYEVDPELFLLHLKFADRERLVAITEHRSSLVALDGRGGGSSWGRPPSTVMEIFDTAVADPGPDVPELDPDLDTAALVVADGERYHAPTSAGQLASLASEPLVRIPSRLRGAL